jgi:cytochrome c
MTRILPFAALALIAAPLLAQTSRTATGDAAAGARQFLRCRACHTVTQGGANTVGPNLWGIAGAKAASRPGFAYSPALSKSGINWTPSELDAYIARPAQRVPGTKMESSGVADPAARRNLIAYLGTLKR